MPRRPVSREYPITAKKSGRNTARSKKAAPAPKRKAAPKSKAAPKRTSYEKRLRDYQRKHPGWRSDPHWKQKARGHKEAEHVERARKFRDRMDAVIERQVRRFPGIDHAKQAAEIRVKLLAKVRAEGEGVLAKVEAKVAQLEKERAQQPLDEHGRPLPLPWVNMKTLEDEWGLPREIFGYH